ncbi:MAG: monovalent cation/hydrogen antiporter [Gaiellaceae bacterium]|jgi:Na+/H+ antiporter|nr:monovalent cation/hydrogen antiporter [Gaiellaceae bacterium]
MIRPGMGLSHHDTLVLLGLLVGIGGLVALSPLTRIPYPIFLVLGGLALGFVPALPTVTLRPEYVLVGVLPALLYASAFFTSLRDLRRNMRAIGLLAIGLVAATVLTVAVVAHEWIGMPWAAAFVLGAVVAPTDPLAASAIFERLGIPRRLVTLIEGESLVNDATALVVYRVAVGAVVTGTFSARDLGQGFIVAVAGGLGVGLVVGYLVRMVRKRIDNPPAEVTLALLTGYLAYLPAELLGASAVLAAVTAGVYLGWHTPELTTPESRLTNDAVWRILQFVLNAILFVFVGLQLPAIVDALGNRSWPALLGDATLISGAVVLTRIIWMYPATYAPRFLFPSLRARDPYPPWQAPTLLAWAGMRGSVSLAAALAIPLVTDAGRPFPGRELIVFLTFSVILVTLVGQGLTLPLVIRWLGLEDDGVLDREEAKARIHAADAALARLEELKDENWVRDDTAERLRGLYGFRKRRFAARFDEGDDGAIEQRSLSYQRLLRELIDAERQSVFDLRRDGKISDETMRRVERDLDLEDTRLDV